MKIVTDPAVAAFMSTADANNMTADEKLRLLAGAVARYLENPGCNIPARQAALARLAWALQQAAPHEIQVDSP